MSHYAYDRSAMPERMALRPDISAEAAPCHDDLEFVISYPNDLLGTLARHQFVLLREELANAFADVADCRIHVRCHSISIRMAARGRAPRELCREIVARLPLALTKPNLPIHCHRIDCHVELDRWDALRAECDATRSLGEQFLPFVMRKGATILEMRMLLQQRWPEAARERIEGLHLMIHAATKPETERAAA